MDRRMTLTDDQIVREVMLAIRVLGEGRGSIPAVGERLIRRLIGLEHEMPVPIADPWRRLSDDAE